MDNNRLNVIERGKDVFLFDTETEDFVKATMSVDEGFLSDAELEAIRKEYHLLSAKHKGKIYFFQDWPI